MLPVIVVLVVALVVGSILVYFTNPADTPVKQNVRKTGFLVGALALVVMGLLIGWTHPAWFFFTLWVVTVVYFLVPQVRTNADKVAGEAKVVGQQIRRDLTKDF